MELLPIAQAARFLRAIPHPQAFSLLLLIFLGTYATADDAKKDASPDSVAIQGEWKFAETTEDGKTYPGVDALIWTFEEGKLTVALEGRTQHSGTYTLKPSSVPAAIDIKVKGATPANLDSDSIGIYKLEKDKLTLCFGVRDAKDKRPTSFTYNAKSPTGTIVLERVK